MQKLVVSTVPPIKIFAALVSILPANRVAKAQQSSSKALAWYLRSTGIRQINLLNQVPFDVYTVGVCEAQGPLSVLFNRFNTPTDVIGSHYIIMAKPH